MLMSLRAPFQLTFLSACFTYHNLEVTISDSSSISLIFVCTYLACSAASSLPWHWRGAPDLGSTRIMGSTFN